MSRWIWRDIAFGWALSAGIHVVLLLGAALVFIEVLMPLDISYTGFDVDCGSEVCRIEPVRAPLDSFDDRRRLLQDSPPIADLDVGQAAAVAQLDSQTFIPDCSSCDWTSCDPPRSGYSGMLLCNFMGSWSSKSTAVADRRQDRARFGKGVRIWTCPPRCLGTDQIQSLIWLARHQNPDGGWSSSGFALCCDRGPCSGAGDPAYDTGVSALSLLAFLGAGYVPVSEEELFGQVDFRRKLISGEVVKKGLRWLIAHQDSEGCVGPRGPKFLVNHAIATLALSEAYGMTAMPSLRDSAQKAVDFLVAAQNPGAGWRYGVRDGESDTSVTGWAVMALKSAELAELSFPPSCYAGALTWLDQVGSSKSGKVTIPGKNEGFDDHPTMSAVALMSRVFIQKQRNDVSLSATLLGDLPSVGAGKVDYYYWYFGSLALYQHDRPGGTAWRSWNEPMQKAILELQRTPGDGCEAGSWDPAVDRWGSEGGRVYATALNTLTLEIYYRFTSVFGAKKPW